MTTGSTIGWAGLQEALAGKVALPGSPAYDRSPRPFNARFDQVRPQAVVWCATPEDVAETVAFARRHGLTTAIRSGGHGFSDHSVTQGVLLDVTPMASVTVDGEVARVGAGTRLGQLTPALRAHDRTMPTGTCPAVGVAGLTLGGGLGLLGRSYGLTSDQLLAAEIVLADGRRIDCDERHDPELFWALRGAGSGQFGVVTSLAFRLRRPPEATANFRLVWPAAQATAVIAAWQGWAPTAPDELAASLVLATPPEPDRPPTVVVFGVLVGGGDAGGLLEQLVDRVGAAPASTFAKDLSWWETLERWGRLDHLASDPAGLAPPDRPGSPGYRVIRSEFFARPLPAEAIAALVEHLQRDRAAGEARELDFTPWGGAYSRVPAAATAFVHRDAIYSLKHAVVVDPGASTAAKGAAHRWADRSWSTVHPWGSGGVFPNFADPELEDWAGAYYGDNLDRLLAVKARYDPGNLFRSRQSLPVR